jgi:hypothetical protein
VQTGEVLRVIARDLHGEDLIECLSVNPAHIGAESVAHARAIQIWESLIRSRSFTAAVIESDSPIGGHRIVGFGASVFVQPSLAEEELAHPRPGLNSRFIASVDSGQRVVLSEPELRSGNTRGGLDSLLLYGCWRKNVLTPDGMSHVCSALAARYLENHRGYRLNRLIVESVGDEESRLFEATHGWRPVQHFDGPGRERSTLWALTRGDSLTVQASIVNYLFQYREPVLHLRDADQELLLAASSGLTDEELSCKLGLTLNAVKKRWIVVFQRTINAWPDLFPATRLKDGQKRGRQKRHHVLAYIRSHPEELRPTL